MKDGEADKQNVTTADAESDSEDETDRKLLAVADMEAESDRRVGENELEELAVDDEDDVVEMVAEPDRVTLTVQEKGGDADSELVTVSEAVAMVDSDGVPLAFGEAVMMAEPVFIVLRVPERVGWTESVGVSVGADEMDESAEYVSESIIFVDDDDDDGLCVAVVHLDAAPDALCEGQADREAVPMGELDDVSLNESVALTDDDMPAEREDCTEAVDDTVVDSEKDALLEARDEVDGKTDEDAETVPDNESDGVMDEHPLTETRMVAVGGVTLANAEGESTMLAEDDTLALPLELLETEGDCEVETDWLTDGVMEKVTGGTSHTRIVKGWLHDPAYVKVTDSESTVKGPIPDVWSKRYAFVAVSKARSAPAGVETRNSMRMLVRAPAERRTVNRHMREVVDAQHEDESAGLDASVMPTPSLS